jgi:hypothetical protein
MEFLGRSFSSPQKAQSQQPAAANCAIRPNRKTIFIASVPLPSSATICFGFQLNFEGEKKTSRVIREPICAALRHFEFCLFEHEGGRAREEEPKKKAPKTKLDVGSMTSTRECNSGSGIRLT